MSSTSVILVKYSELALKGGNRASFEKRLVDNLKRGLGSTPVQVERLQGRILIRPRSAEAERLAFEVLERSFGVHSYVSARSTSNDLSAISRAAAALIGSSPPNTFAVRARRALKSFPSSSQEIAQAVGRTLQSQFPKLTVDLDQPETAVFVEVRSEGAFVYLNRDINYAPGGLPEGISGRGLLLLSGGIDSPVAGWWAMKRGLAMDAVYFHSPPHTSDKAREKVLDLARVLARWKGRPMRVFVPRLTDIQLAITRRGPEKYWTVLLRRSMRRLVGGLAARPPMGLQPYQTAVTGDSLAQVASQTLENLAAAEAASDLLTLRPLIGFDKSEIVARAQAIGTYEISIRPFLDCCSALTPRRPATHSRRSDLERAEVACGLAELESQALSELRLYEVSPQEIREIREAKEIREI